MKNEVKEKNVSSANRGKWSLCDPRVLEGLVFVEVRASITNIKQFLTHIASKLDLTAMLPEGTEG